MHFFKINNKLYNNYKYILLEIIINIENIIQNFYL